MGLDLKGLYKLVRGLAISPFIYAACGLRAIKFSHPGRNIWTSGTDGGLTKGEQRNEGFKFIEETFCPGRIGME